ncbi:hypothetical protein [Mycobacterium aquaticum]|uniref:Uncharacterized protein n=1 Tax=Mycobacterium aquaticum TaxID=1927124 RepID=A0A1X0ABF0_9MYCO|nr:hypothetical protein [Mycobacterium aquaticum]ORA27369.1 hypothetical protein BST13_30385 [Mycobacterium aquaticum]
MQRIDNTPRRLPLTETERNRTMARFTPADPVRAAEAVAALPAAAREVAAAAANSVVALAEVPADPQAALDAYATMRRGADAIRAAEDLLILRLHEAGASVAGLANALSINRLTIERRIAAAKAARNA